LEHQLNVIFESQGFGIYKNQPELLQRDLDSYYQVINHSE
jgi:hypothetical protein